MIKKYLSKISSGTKLFIIVFVLYLGLAIFKFNVFSDSLDGFLILIKKILPVLLFVFVLFFFSDLFLTSKVIGKYVGKKSGIKGYFFAVLFGILSMGPIYMWYPFLADLKEKGMKDSLIAVFLYNRAVKIPLLPMMIYYFGLKFVVVLTLYMVVFSVLSGGLIQLFLTKKK